MAINVQTNPEDFVALEYNPYQWAFLNARRERICVGTCTNEEGRRFTWSVVDHGVVCPKCGIKGSRSYRRMFLRAGRRGGKTRIGALSGIEEAMCVPGSIGWACAPSYPELHDYVLPAFFGQLPQEIFDHPMTEWSKDRLSLVLPNRSQVHFRSLDDPNRGTGPGLDWLWIDEGRKIQEIAWNILRPTLAEKKGVAWVTTSPDWGEDWCHRNFWVPAVDGRPGYWAATFKTIDNPTIDPAIIEEDRATMPPELFRREYEASIEYPTGTIYGGVLDATIADDDRIRKWIPEWPKIEPSRLCIVGIDPGTDHPFAAVLIIVTPFGLVVAGEYAERGKTYLKHSEGIRAMLGGVTGLQPRFGIDKSQAQGAIELAQHGIYAAAAPNAVDAGIQRVYAWMSTGKMLVSKTKCPRLLRDLQKYRWADLQETKKGLPGDAQPFKKDDDLPDALRYAVMLWPELPVQFALTERESQKQRLAMMSEEDRAVVLRNAPPDDDTESGLVRVTDGFSPIEMQERPLGDSSLGDFYQ